MTPLIAFTAAWCAGILIAQAALFSPRLFLIPLPLLPALWWVRREPAARWSLWLLAGLMAGAGRYLLAAPHFDAAHVARYVGAEGTLVGVVEAEPIPHRTTTHLRVAAERLRRPDGETLPLHGSVLVLAPPQTTAFYGDRIEATGTLAPPPVFEGFDYRGYLARRDIYVVMERGTEVVIRERHLRSPLVEAMLRFKRQAVARLQAILPEPHASLLAGILLGVEWGIPQDLDEAFAATGTSHIVAISGFNLTIVAGLFAALARTLFGRRRETWIALGGLWSYTFLVGGGAAVLRAAVMGSLVILARREGRPLHGPTALAAAAWLMSLADPFILWDVGFQLSLAATAGILLFQPALSAWLLRLLQRRMAAGRAEKLLGLLEESFVVTLAAQITTTPILVATFHRLSLITLLTNFLILPAQPYVMLFGGVALAASLLWLPPGRVAAAPAWAVLDYTIRVVRATASLPWASVEVGQVALGGLWGYYLLLLAGHGWLGLKPLARRRLWGSLRARPAWQWTGAAAGIAALAALLLSLPDGRLHLWFLPVHGNALLVQTPHGHHLLIDGSDDPSALLEAVDAHLPWYDRRLDAVILTAPQAEELPGLSAVLERYRVERVVLPPLEGGDEAAAFRAQVEGGAAARWSVVRQGTEWQVDGLSIAVLWPPGSEAGPLVLRLDYGERTVLLPPHATAPMEMELATRGDLRCDLLLAPRHGAPTALTPAFLARAAPAMILFDEEPSPQALARAQAAAIVYRGEGEEVAFVSDGRALWTRAQPAGR